MSIHIRLGLALVASAVFLGSPATFAGDQCCGGEQAKGDATGLAARDAKCEKCAEAVLVKLAAPAPKLTAADEKVLAEAKHTLVSTCPMGKFFTGAIHEIAQAIQ